MSTSESNGYFFHDYGSPLDVVEIKNCHKLSHIYSICEFHIYSINSDNYTLPSLVGLHIVYGQQNMAETMVCYFRGQILKGNPVSTLFSGIFVFGAQRFHVRTWATLRPTFQEEAKPHGGATNWCSSKQSQFLSCSYPGTSYASERFYMILPSG